jgi:hypothetical protein
MTKMTNCEPRKVFLDAQDEVGWGHNLVFGIIFGFHDIFWSLFVVDLEKKSLFSAPDRSGADFFGPSLLRGLAVKNFWGHFGSIFLYVRIGVDVVNKKGLRHFFVKWPGMASGVDFLGSDPYNGTKWGGSL